MCHCTIWVNQKLQPSGIRAIVERNWVTFGTWGYWYNMYGILWPSIVQSFGIISSQTEPASQKRPIVGMKFGKSGSLVAQVSGIVSWFNLLVFKFILGSFSGLLSKWQVSLKQLVVMVHRVKFGTPGHHSSTCTCYYWPCSVQCHLGSSSAFVAKWPLKRLS